MLEIQERENVDINNMIYEIRGKLVMLDSDVAMLFGYKTKELNRNVRNNINRFPENYCFQLTEEEYNYLRCNFFTSSLKNNYGGRRYLPYVFTEYGITMLAGILKSEIAVSVSLKIVDTFISMRRFISSSLLEQKYINNQVMKNTEDIKLLQESFKKFDKNKHLNNIFFEGQIYDAYSLLIDILSSAAINIIIIDNYIDKKFLDICSKINTSFTIYTSKINENDLNKYNKQYNNIEVIISNKFHDRFIILDNETLYHSGASFKDLGKKCFAINKIENDQILEELLKIVNS